jgi:hypothetical protein
MLACMTDDDRCPVGSGSCSVQRHVPDFSSRAGLTSTRGRIHCLDPQETLSAGQAEGIDRLYATYPEWHDDAFVANNLDRWRA